jgi:alpha-1,3-rhamnosyl/mannosyltransferase
VWNWDIYHTPWCQASINIPDILPVEYPEWFDGRFQRMTDKSLEFAANHAAYVFVISQDVRLRVSRHLGIDPSRIKVVYPAINPAFLAPATTEGDTEIIKRLGLTAHQYFLSYGFLEPRKNIERQLHAFRNARKSSGSKYKFVVVGVETHRSRGINEAIDKLGMTDAIIRIPYLPLGDLIALLRQSAALAYCSIAEGFGLPIVEAMAAGTDVITSNTTSMAELGANRCELVNPFDVDEMAAAFTRQMSQRDSNNRKIRTTNRQYAEQFTPANWLAGHLEAYRNGE